MKPPAPVTQILSFLSGQYYNTGRQLQAGCRCEVHDLCAAAGLLRRRPAVLGADACCVPVVQRGATYRLEGVPRQRGGSLVVGVDLGHAAIAKVCRKRRKTRPIYTG